MVGSIGLHGNDATLAERRNLVRTKAKLAENLSRMLTDRRRLPLQREIVGADLDRQPRQLGAETIGEVNLQHAAAGIELRIVEQIARLRHWRERNIDAVEQFGKFSLLMLGDDAGYDRPQRATHAHAIFIRLIRRVLQKVLPGERAAKPLPVAVAGQPDKNLLAIGSGERLIDAPGAFPRR